MGSHGEPMRARPTALSADKANGAGSLFYTRFLQQFFEKAQWVAESYSEPLCSKSAICLESEKFFLLDPISKLSF
jgi:hypothetical protein